MSEEQTTGSLTIGRRGIWRQLLANPSVVLTIFIATLVAALFVAAAPRFIEAVSSEALREAITTPPPQQRNIGVEKITRIGAGVGDDPFERVGDTGETFAEEEMSPAVRAIITDQTWIVDSPQFGVFPMPGTVAPSRGRAESRGSRSVCPVCSDELPDEGPFPQFVRLRYQEEIEEHATLVRGALPRERDPMTLLVGPDCPHDPAARDAFEESEEVRCRFDRVPVYEVAMTAETLSVLSFGLGDMVLLKPDTDDSLFASVPRADLEDQWVLRVSGIIELTSPEDEYWYGDARLHKAIIAENPDFRIIFATGLMEPNAYWHALRDSPGSWRYAWRNDVDPDLVEPAEVERLAADVRNLELSFRSLSSHPGDFSVITLLPALIEEYLVQRSLTMSLMSIALAGVFAVAVAVILELGGLVTLRQRAPTILIRGRGSSPGQLTLTRLYQGLLLVAPAAALGYYGATWLVPGTDDLLPYRAAVALAAGTTVVFVLAGAPLFFARLGALQGKQAGSPEHTGLRLVFELLVVTVALGSIVLLRRRGLIDMDTSPVFDPLLAAAPAVIGVAVGLMTLRVYPLLVGAAAKLLSRGSALVPFVGLRRILHQPRVARMPLAVILIAVAIAVFSLLVRDSIDQGQRIAAWQEVGADYRITGSAPGNALSAAVDLSGLDGIDASAGGALIPDATPLGDFRGKSQYLAIESVAYESVVSGTDGDPVLPGFMFARLGSGAGTERLPIPVIVSSQGWLGQETPSVGDVFPIDLGTSQPVVEVREVRDRFPGLPIDRPFVVSDIAPLDQLSDAPAPGRTILFVRAPRSVGPLLATTISEQSGSMRFASRYEVLSEVSSHPLAAAVDNGLLVTFGLSTVFAIVAAISSLALSTAIRRRDFGYLRTLGLSSRQAVKLTLIEQLPLLAVATAVGSLLGVGIIIALRPAIDLEAFSGGLLSVSIQYDWPTVVMASALLMAAMSVSILVFIAVNRNDDLGRLLKVGEE